MVVVVLFYFSYFFKFFINFVGWLLIDFLDNNAGW